jgi:hypothetical protein
MKTIVPIVEGHGENDAVGIILRKMLEEHPNISTSKPVRQHRGKIVKPGELEKAIRLAMRTRKHADGILILLDADEDCPGKLGPALLDRARAAYGHIPISVVIAKREFENWFMGSLEAFRGQWGIPHDAEIPEDPEDIDSKGRISKLMGVKYIETLHQAKFAAKLDLKLCKEWCPSFDKFCRDVEWLIQEINARERT